MSSQPSKPTSNTKLLVKDVMTRDVVSVNPGTSLPEVAKILIQHRFDGVPVVDGTNTLVGIVTEYDLVSRTLALHLPTFQVIIKNLPVFRKDRAHFQKEIEQVSSLTVADVMNREPLTLKDSATFWDAVENFRAHHRVNPIPVIDRAKKLVGIVSRSDILKFLLLSTDV